MIAYPFWLVLPGNGKDQVEGGPETNRRLLAFSSVPNMNAYLSAHREGEWNVQLVNRYSSLTVLADLLAKGCTSLCLDANDINAGQEILLQEILRSRRANDR